MDIGHYIPALANEYYAWGTTAAYPRDARRYVEVLDTVQGMTTPSTMHLLNFAVQHLDEGECYLEVGTWRGATLIGAMLGNSAPAYAIDDSSMVEFNKDERASAEVWRENVARAGVRATYIDGKVPDVFTGLSLPPVGVYLFDGDKATAGAAMDGLLAAVPFLAQRAVLVVDDANAPTVREAMARFEHRYRGHCAKLLDLPTPGNCFPCFWNGLAVIGWGVQLEWG